MNKYHKKIYYIYIIVLFFVQSFLYAWFEHDRAVSALQKGNIDQACSLLTSLVTDYPEDPDVLYDLGVAAYKKQECAQAAAYFSQAATYAEQTPLLKERAHFNAGNCFVRNKSYQDAIDQYEKVLALNVDNEQARHNLAKARQLLEQQKQQEEQKKQQQNNTSDKQNDDNESRDTDQQSEQENNHESSDDTSSEQNDDTSSDKNNPDDSKSSQGQDQKNAGSSQQKSPNQGTERNNESNSQQEESEQNGKESRDQQKSKKSQQEPQGQSGQAPYNQSSDARDNKQEQQYQQHMTHNNFQDQDNKKDALEQEEKDKNMFTRPGEHDELKNIDPRLVRILQEQELHDAQNNKQLLLQAVGAGANNDTQNGW